MKSDLEYVILAATLVTRAEAVLNAISPEDRHIDDAGREALRLLRDAIEPHTGIGYKPKQAKRQA